MLTTRSNIDQLEPSLVSNIDYHSVEDHNKWRVNMMNELIDIKQGNIILPEGWLTEEVDSLLTFVCTEWDETDGSFLIFLPIFRSFPGALPFYKKYMELSIFSN